MKLSTYLTAAALCTANAFGLATQAAAMDQKAIVNALQTSCTSDPRDLHTCIDTMSKMTLVLSTQIQKSVGEQAPSKNWEIALLTPITTMCHTPLQTQIEKKAKTAADYRALVALTSNCKREFDELGQRKTVSSMPFLEVRKVLDAKLGWTSMHPLLGAR